MNRVDETYKTFPGFHIEPVSGAASVICTCFPPTCDPLEPGISLKVIRFDMYSGKPVAISRGISRGPIWEENRTLTEIRWIDEEPVLGRRFRLHWLFKHETSDEIVLTMREIRDMEGGGIIETTDIRHPIRLFSHRKHVCRDEYRRGRRIRKETFRIRTDGPFELHLGLHRHRVLRSVSVSEVSKDRKVERYLDTGTGRVVLVRVLAKDAKAPPDPFIPKGYRWTCAYLPVWTISSRDDRVQTV